ncbi:polyprenyl diphosphate synthase [Sulfurovum sp. NBC37-1]|uniref:polyprenyl diphosphate synthase n=1 Tax=Sulfurovum sp. (strain NBC37-1) TaxID=387093 RepID=UPI0001587B30|nr:polyprenyl diphosphate synthase [Sulfurovum sp. NBC37-1]BAF72785.1 undecaprenyl diphosphate synthase [Sulfurovum sp. NBC37-1]
MPKTTLKNLAIIMDGNGRWAQQRGLNRTKGHEQGAEIIRDVTVYCAKHPSIETVTFYAFSTENWKRPKLEVEFLMKLLDRYLQKELDTYQNNNVCFEAIGNIGAFSDKLQKRIKITEEATRNNTDLTHILALNYGGRAEITAAVNKLITEGKKEVTEADISSALQTPYSDIDLLIRTSGEERISNYLLWQISYAELYFTETLWPDFTTQELDEIVTDFEQRTRRFGGLA